MDDYELIDTSSRVMQESGTHAYVIEEELKEMPLSKCQRSSP